jgi:O-antigen/teichoic acid export membrane protein
LSSSNTQPADTVTPQTASKGMTTKVVKGSFWVLMGQVVPMIATFIASPFVIRYLGSEAYGVLLLVALIPSYFSFTDVGMSMASTKFGSEAYGNGLPDKEAMAIRTAAYIAFFPTLIVAALLFIFSGYIVNDFFRVPAKYSEVADFGLKLTAVAFFISAMTSIFNTPQLSRLKMNLNILVNAGPKIIMTSLTPFVLYWGFGIKGATILACAIAIIILLLNLYTSGRLLPQLFRFSIDKSLLKPMLAFGKGIVFYAIALMLINNTEKILLPRLMDEPTKHLAYYSVAFTLANMTNLFSMAMVQTLIPAFSQLLTPDKRSQLSSLFSRCVRIGLIALIPSVMGTLVIAKPFFTIWAGKEFGAESVLPFYVLLIGVFFGLLAYVPNTILLASGKSKLFARFYVLEIIPYGLLTYFLIKQFGIIGAAMAWSIKEVTNALTFIYFTKKHTGLVLNIKHQWQGIIAGFLVFLPAVLVALLYNNFSYWLVLLLPVCLIMYFIVVWKKLIDAGEREWITAKLKRIVG